MEDEDEYGDLFGGGEQWIKLYKYACPSRYCFIHMDLQENPPVMYRNFDEVIAIGDKPVVNLGGVSSDIIDNKGKEDSKEMLAEIKTDG